MSILYFLGYMSMLNGNIITGKTLRARLPCGGNFLCVDLEKKHKTQNESTHTINMGNNRFHGKRISTSSFDRRELQIGWISSLEYELLFKL